MSLRRRCSIITLSLGLACPIFAAGSHEVHGRGKLASAKVEKAKPAKKLYDRLGGKPAIKAVVDEFVANCAKDTRVNSFFAAVGSDPARMAAFKTKVVDQVCQASGGPCKYTGRSMKEAHKGMGISDAQFNAVVEDLTKALDKFKVPAPEKTELLAALSPMRPDIVEKK
jgi:hemoglobin